MPFSTGLTNRASMFYAKMLPASQNDTARMPVAQSADPAMPDCSRPVHRNSEVLQNGRITTSGSRGHAVGLLRRLAALGYDLLLLFGLLFCLTWLLLLLRAGATIEPGTWWFDLSLPALAFMFFGWFWTHGGQTLGMRAWQLRVVRLDGHPLTWRDALVRYVAALAGAAALGLGFFWAFLDPDSRCWHDRVSRTRLVRTRRAASADARKSDQSHDE